MPTIPTYSQPNSQNPAKSHFKLQTLAAYQGWISQHDWDVFGTLNFTPNHKANIDTAQKQWSRFWNQVDRRVYGDTGCHNIRVERVVCTQFGSLGDNPHLHFLAKSPINTKDFCIYLNALWADISPESAPPHSNEILPLLDVKKASGYLLHDYWHKGSETFNAEFTYLNTEETKLVPRSNAADRLKAATNKTWLAKAQLAFDDHIEIAQVRYNKRHAN